MIANAAGDPGIVVPLGEEIDPIDFVEIVEGHQEEDAKPKEEEMIEEEHEGEEDHHGELDPHFWFDPLRVQQAVSSIAAQLSTVDPAGQATYRENAAGVQ